MAEEKKTRMQFTKAEKRALAEETTRIALTDELRSKADRDIKTEKLRALRLQRDHGGSSDENLSP